ncbi:MAG: hypothetical protein M3O71_15880 [Bacteroidota bacterium]|nr:hypothetical protein [Bacteroidota bacterium]
MKTKINSFTRYFIAIPLLSAFQIGPSATLVGTWKLTSLTAIYPKNMTSKARSTAEADIKSTSERLKQTTFVFSKDGHLSFAKHTGTYVIGKDGKTVDFVNYAKEKSTGLIVKLTTHDLEFTREDDGLTQVFHLVK